MDQLIDGKGGLKKLSIATDLCQGEIYLQGAHVTQFHPRAQAHPVLWMSNSAVFQTGRAIRGGVPICFPWFGPKADDPSAAVHGFGRLMEWKLEGVSTDAAAGTVVRMSLRSDERTRAAWPFDFTADFVVAFGRELKMQLTVKNDSPALAKCEAALHSYFTVGDIRQTQVRGLENTAYLDRLRPGESFRQGDDPITFSAETDRTYVGTTSTTTIVDPVLGRRIVIDKTGSRSTVVWNPWIAKAKAMADFGDDEWPGMLCIETANVSPDAIVLAPGASHTTAAVISAAV